MNRIGKREAGRWKRVLEGLVSAVLVLPVPAFAAVDSFQWGTPVYSGSDTDPIASYDTGLTTPSQGVLLLKPVSGSVTLTAGGDTWTITGTFNVTGAATTLGGSWSNLNDFDLSRAGSSNVNIKVTLTGNGIPTNNMFGNGGTTYSTSNPPPASVALTNSQSLAVATSYSVQVQFTFDHGGFMGSASTSIWLTMDEVSSP